MEKTNHSFLIFSMKIMYVEFSILGLNLSCFLVFAGDILLVISVEDRQ